MSMWAYERAYEHNNFHDTGLLKAFSFYIFYRVIKKIKFHTKQRLIWKSSSMDVQFTQQTQQFLLHY